MASINVTHGPNKFTIEFPENLEKYGRTWANHTVLKDLIEKCSEKTGVKAQNIKLLASGGKPNSFFSSLLGSPTGDSFGCGLI